MDVPDKSRGRGKPAPPTAEETIAIEEELLRALCQSTCGGGSSLLEEQLRIIGAYRFRDPTHQIVFDTLCEFRLRVAGTKAGQETIREQVARRLTLKGFPDVDLEILFCPQSAGEQKKQFARCILRLTGVHDEHAKDDEQ